MVVHRPIYYFSIVYYIVVYRPEQLCIVSHGQECSVSYTCMHSLHIIRAQLLQLQFYYTNISEMLSTIRMDWVPHHIVYLCACESSFHIGFGRTDSQQLCNWQTRITMGIFSKYICDQCACKAQVIMHLRCICIAILILSTD